MPNFYVIIRAARVTEETFLVEADTREEAIRLWREGEGDLINTEVVSELEAAPESAERMA